MLPLVLAVAIGGQAPAPDMQCRSSVQGQPITRSLDGFTLEMRRKPDPAPPETACVAELRDASGKAVFTREGFNTALHPESGRDVDNDGAPDLVIGHDARAGNRCCREYTIVSLKPAPHAAGTFANPSFDVDASRRAVVWTMLPFDELGPDMGPSPAIAIAHQYRDGRFAEITPEYCSTILAGTARGRANLSEDLWQLEGSHLARAKAETATPPSFEVEKTRVSATTVALQMIYCGLDADARRLIGEAWPDADRDKTFASFAAAIAAVRRR